MARGPFSYRPGELRDRILTGEAVKSLQREVNRVFEELGLEQPIRPAAPTEASPPPTAGAGSITLDVDETPTAVIVSADLPGVAEEDVDVTLTDDVLTIRAERRPERGATLRERATGVFSRTVRLPAAVDEEGVRAEFKLGVLTVTLPKPAVPERGRKIPVNAAPKPSAADAPSAETENATMPDGADHGGNA